MRRGSLLLDGLGDDADVGDAGLLDCVHDGGEGAEGDGLIGADVDDFLFVLRVPCKDGGEVVDVDGLVLQEDVLILVNGDDEMLFGELIDLSGLRDCYLDAGLEDGGGDHEDEEEDEDDVDQRRDVDVGEGGLGFAASGEGHVIASGGDRLDWGEGPGAGRARRFRWR
jgi:hypothetical protein